MDERDGGAGVFVVGSLHLDVIVHAARMPGRDETLPGEAVDYAFGGKGGNQAVAAAQHGAPTAMAGRVGNDAFAARLTHELDRAGVDRTQVRAGPGASGMSVAIVDERGDYGAVVVTGANREIDAAAITLPQNTAVVVLQNEIPEAVSLALAARAREAGLRVMLNAAPARPMADALWTSVDLLVVNRVEAAGLAGRAVITPDDAASAASDLAARGPDVLVTLGADGVVGSTDGGVLHRPAHTVEVVSTHGAGDAFMGALAARLAGGTPLPEAIDYAQGAAALHVSRPVADRRHIDAATVQAFLAERDGQRPASQVNA